MILFPNAKINIGLDVLEKRSDGFHELATVFYPVKLYDALELIPCTEEPLAGISRAEISGSENPWGRTRGTAVSSPFHTGESSGAGKGWEFTSSGNNESISDQDNLCVRAYELLARDMDLPRLKMHLHKNIPVGAGLGGGSADAAFALRLLNEFFDLGLSLQQLMGYARKLGSDCAFFLENKPVYAFGKGDEFRPFSLDLSDYYIVIVMPGILSSTAEAYRNVRPRRPAIPLEERLNTPLEQWRNGVENAFEHWLFATWPAMKEIKEQLYAEGALYAAVTGSGAALYGIFPQKIRLNRLESTCRVFYDVG